MKSVLIEMEKLKNPYSGLGQFCFHIGKQFQHLKLKNLELDFYLPSDQKNIFGDSFNYISHTPLHKLFPVSSNKFNVWHCLHQDSHYFPTNKNTRLILTIHDLNFLEKYQGLKQKNKLKDLQKKVNRAQVITVISKFTERIVMENLELNNTPVHVIYNGNSLKIPVNENYLGVENYENYFFSIGVISAKKNFKVLLPLLQHFENMKLIIAGNNTSEYAKELISLAEKSKVADRLILPGNVSESIKYQLYKSCRAFLFPSLSEGFGLPIVEAMSLGKPVFLSSLTSLPEIGGIEAFYWKNFEPQHIVEVVENGLIDYFADIEKRNRIIQWSKQFTWQSAAKAYFELYEKI